MFNLFVQDNCPILNSLMSRIERTYEFYQFYDFLTVPI